MMPASEASPDAHLQLRLAPKKADSSRWVSLGDKTLLRLGDVTVPTQRFRKELIRTGGYVKVSDGIAFTVTMGTLANWVLQFNRMKAAGLKVPVPFVHQDEKWEKSAQDGDPRDNGGWVDSLFVDGDTLVMVCTLKGADALVAARRSDVSINSPPKIVSGKGDTFIRPITHVAMVTDPVVPGLGEFVPLAASLRLQEQAVMLEFLQKMASVLGIDPAQIIDEVTGKQLIVDAVAGMVSQLGGAADAGDAAAGDPGAGAGAGGGGGGGRSLPGLPRGTPPPIGAAGQPIRKETTTREFAASGADDTKVDPLLISMAKMQVENRMLKLQQRVDSGHLAPAQATKFAELWATEEVVQASLAAGSTSDDFDKMLAVIDMAEPALKPGGKTGPQTKLKLSDPLKDGKPKVSGLVASAERRAKQAQESAIPR